jgi:hypothetical protein
MRRILWIVLGLCLCGLPFGLLADTFQLTDGGSVTGDIINFNDSGVSVRAPGDVYTNIAWTKFSQESLKQLANDPKYNQPNKPGMKVLVEPFIEVSPSDRSKKAEIKIKDEKDMSILKLPPKQSLIPALFSSSVGIVLILLIYAANIYAGFEIALFRGRPIGLVMGIAAVLPVIGPIIFLSMPTYIPPPVEETQPQPEAHFTVPGQEIKITASSWQQPTAEGTIQPEVVERPQPPEVQPQIFQRGQFTFNRRFFETKFGGYFGMSRTGEAKSFNFFLRTGAGTFEVQRVTRIAVADVHLEVIQGGTIREISVPFADIQEIQLKPKAA